jgi:hypothetical protein
MHIACAIDEVPFEGQSTIACTRPVETYVVKRLEGCNQVVGVGAGSVSDSKIVDDETENDVASGVVP